MNKLTETDKAKEYLELCQRRMVYDESTHIIASLLSLLEEKDKALAFYEDVENWTPYPNSLNYECKILDDCGEIARKALHTSSNTEREV